MTARPEGGAGGRAPVYFLLHLPKTAGQTLTGHLQRHCTPGTYLEPRRKARLPDDVSGVRALSGHWLAQSMEPAFAGREIRNAILLRDPVGVQVSLYNFHMMTYEAKALGGYSFALHLAAQPRNFLTHCLLHRWAGIGRARLALMSDAEQFSRADAILRRFWFVGSYRDCDRLIASIAGDLGVPVKAAPRNTLDWHRTFSNLTPLQIEDLDPAIVDRIVRDHPVDLALWRRWVVRDEASPALSTASHWASVTPRVAAEVRRRWRRDLGTPRHRGQARRVARAIAAAGAQDWPRAVTLYRRAVARGGSVLLWLDYARALRESGDVIGALAAFDRALALKPDQREIAAERERCALGLTSSR